MTNFSYLTGIGLSKSEPIAKHFDSKKDLASPSLTVALFLQSVHAMRVRLAV